MLSQWLLLSVLPIVYGKTIVVSVGQSGLMFNPPSVAAAVGDKVEFVYYPQDHNVVQSEFSSPCQPMSGGIYSGFFPVVSGVGATSFTVTINDTNPIWYYCGQVGHCQAGMVGVINPPSSGNTLDAYKSAAGKAQTGTNPTVVSGGVVSAVVPASGGSGSSSAAGTSTSVVGISTTAGGSSTSAGGSSTSVGGTSTSAVGTSTSTGKSSGTTGSITSNPASSTSSGVVATTSAPSGVMGIKDTKADVLAMVLALLFGIGTAMLMA